MQPCDDNSGRSVELNVFRSMIAAVSISVIASAAFMPWRFTTGLVLGGMLALINYHWLRSSVAAIFNIDAAAEKPQVKISRHILRYFVVGLLAFMAYQLRFVSLAATITGLCAFVPALFVEAARQFYFIIIHREESV